MKIAGFGADEARFEMTAMMDIVFQLIAFFMIVSTFIVAEKIEVDLPVAPNSVNAENQQGRLVFSLTADGTVWVGAQAVALEDVAAYAQAWREQQAIARVVIRSDRATPYSHVKQVMKLCRDAGITDLIFASHQSDS